MAINVKQLIIIILIFCLPVSVYAEGNFNDVTDKDWYSEWVGIMKELNMTSGYPDGSFKPNNKLKGIELLSFTLKALKYDIPKSEGYWGQGIIDKAIDEKLIDKGSLIAQKPEEFISRGQAARVIYNAYLKNNPKIAPDIDQRIRKDISDIDDINDEQVEAVVGLLASGIVEGYDDKSFKANKQLTRAEASVLIIRLALKEKRVQVLLELPTFEYKTTSKRAKSFKLHYDPKYQDIYNILSIIDTIENEDVTDSFAVISPLGDGNGHSVGLFPSMKELDEATSIEIIDITTWKLNLTRNPVETNIKQGEIQIKSWRSVKDMETCDGIKATLKYLFGKEYDLVWNKIVEYHVSPSNTGTWERVINNRDVKIFSGTIGGITLNISRIDNIPKINPEEFK